jgi:hypothetical protein
VGAFFDDHLQRKCRLQGHRGSVEEKLTGWVLGYDPTARNLDGCLVEGVLGASGAWLPELGERGAQVSLQTYAKLGRGLENVDLWVPRYFRRRWVERGILGASEGVFLNWFGFL